MSLDHSDKSREAHALWVVDTDRHSAGSRVSDTPVCSVWLSLQLVRLLAHRRITSGVRSGSSHTPGGALLATVRELFLREKEGMWNLLPFSWV